MSAERPHPQPNATLVGWVPPGVLSFPALWIASTLGVVAAIAFVADLLGPGARWPVLGPLRISWRVALVAALAAAAMASFVVSRWARARSGTVEVFDDRVVVSRLVHATAVFYSDVDGFRDDSSAYVVLLPSGDLLPTPSESGRTALLAALSHAGVPRLAPGERARPRARPDHGPPLVAAGALPLPELALGLAALVVVLALTHSPRWAPDSWLPSIFKLVIGPQLLVLFAPAVFVGLHLGPRRGVVVLHDDRVQLASVSKLHTPARKRAPTRLCLKTLRVFRQSLGRPPSLRLRRPVELGWGDIVGFRAGSVHSIALVPRPGSLRQQLEEPTVPTPTSELRAAVEALLASRGVPRL